MEWQPIETAPMDGTWVVVCGHMVDQRKEDDQRPRVARYLDVIDCWLDDDNDEIDIWRRLPAWEYAHWDGAWRSVVFDPTHWMPLPEPPK